MRIDSKLVSPSLWKALDAYEAGIYAGRVGEGWAKHQQIWWKTYGKGFLLGSIAYVALLIGSIAVSRTLDSPALMLLTLGALSAHAVWAYSRNRRSLTPEELEALLPDLQLTPNGRIYAECLVALHRAPIDPASRREAMVELQALMADEDQLATYRAEAEAIAASSDADEVLREIEVLEAKLNSVTDPVAQATYAQSLEIARGRLDSANRYRPYFERVDAQLEVVRQTLLRFRSDLGRASGSGRLTALESLPGLRRSALEIRSHAEEIERAVEELRQG